MMKGVEKPFLPDLYVGDPEAVEKMMDDPALKISAMKQAGMNWLGF